VPFWGYRVIISQRGFPLQENNIMPKKIKSIKKESKKFKLSLNFSGIIYQGEGNTILEALEEVKSKTNKFLIKTWGIFTLLSGGKKAELEMRPFQIRNLLYGGGFAKDLLSKRIEMRLK
jgi:hypothetical protein